MMDDGCQVDIKLDFGCGADVSGHVNRSWQCITWLGLSHHKCRHQSMPDLQITCRMSLWLPRHCCMSQDLQLRRKTCHVHRCDTDGHYVVGRAGCWRDLLGHACTQRPPLRHHMSWDVGHSRHDSGSGHRGFSQSDRAPGYHACSGLSSLATCA